LGKQQLTKIEEGSKLEVMKLLIREARSELKRLRRFVGEKTNKMLVVVLILSVGLALGLYEVNKRRVEKSFKEQMLYRQELIVRTGSQMVEGFSGGVWGGLINAVKMPVFVSPGPGTQAALDGYRTQWEETALVEMIIVDVEGVEQYRSSRGNQAYEEESFFGEREYFSWAKTAKTGEVFWGEPIWLEAEGYMVPVAAALMTDNQFRGVMVFNVLLSQLIEGYLNPLKISEETRVYLLNQEGVILYSPINELIGMNYLEILKEDSYPESERVVGQVKDVLEMKKEGRLDIKLVNVQLNKLVEYLVAYNPMRINNKDWTLGLATPVDDALVFAESLRANLVTVLMVVLLLILAFSVLLILSLRMVKKDAYEEGFKVGRSRRLSKKKGKRK